MKFRSLYESTFRPAHIKDWPLKVKDVQLDLLADERTTTGFYYFPLPFLHYSIYLSSSNAIVTAIQSSSLATSTGYHISLPPLLPYPAFITLHAVYPMLSEFYLLISPLFAQGNTGKTSLSILFQSSPFTISIWNCLIKFSSSSGLGPS